METTIHVKDTNTNIIDWSRDQRNQIESFCLELKVAVNMYHSLEHIRISMDIDEGYNNLPDVSRYYDEHCMESLGMYTKLYENILRRIAIWCEIERISLIITLRKNGMTYKTFLSKKIIGQLNTGELKL